MRQRTFMALKMLKARLERAYENPLEGHSFWKDALAWQGSITARVLPRTVLFGCYGALVAIVHRELLWKGVLVSHIQYSAGFLALLLVLRTNAGYERWWEARKLWGGIVNQSRNLCLKGLHYGPEEKEWRESFVKWCSAFCHATRASLRGKQSDPSLERLLGHELATELKNSTHMPSYVAAALATLLQNARSQESMDGFAFIEADRERALLIDHVGACERILKTPLPRVHSIKLRRFILLYMLGFPLAVASSSISLSAIVSTLVAYPLFAIDQIGQELENPFSPARESHLPLDRICETIENNLFGLLRGHASVQNSAQS